ncbi:Fatty acid desaturase [Gemmata sp. SH-PL17]|uniref:fatty acid desaturase family protein n=1 Tax=Gemmata sp. SH-PL17 TaxID=1630693 RepID=UPI0004BA8F3A|nr:fatty acid desaturase [Gemmata sp. SH-PL17]AMV24102.1 Fatty acid desaturase [Gemmata sp. SH-PL17]
MPSPQDLKLPSLNELGRDLLAVPWWRVALSLSAPFVFTFAYFGFAVAGHWVFAVGSVVALSFVTYGSVSHDLVHRTLRLPKWWNEFFLTTIELLLFRSGRAYRLAHLNHHARYPDAPNDPEAAAAHGGLWGALASGPLFFLRLWVWAVRRYPAHRTRLMFEGCAIAILVVAAVGAAVCGWSIVPLVYVGTVYLGTWIVPLATAYVPHTPNGDSPLSQTRRFRGRLARLIALDHLYHLEHHLYPAVPHHRWPELGRRLDPVLDRSAVPVIRLGL